MCRTMANKTLLIFILTVIGACTQDFEELAINPNNPEDASPSLLMVHVIRDVVDQMVDDAFRNGNVVAQYATQIREPNIDRYIWADFNTWDVGYNTLRDINNIYEIATQDEHDNYRGIALTWKSLVFSQLTDAYGDLPFSQSLKGKSENIYFPVYDTQAEIYAGILADLEEANNLLSVDGRGITNDILYDGDILKWKKFANSLRMRLLMRQSTQVNPSAELTAMLADPAQYPIFESNNDQAILTYTNSPNYFPLGDYDSGHFYDRRLSKSLSDVLNAVNDPRISVYAQPTEESRIAYEAGTGFLEWEGIQNGETDENLSSDIDERISALGSVYYISPQMAVPAEGLIMTYAELEFILAEAAQNGWIERNPETHYLNGISASIAYYSGLSGEDIIPEENFYTQPGIAYDPSRGLEQIGIQKWVALFFNDLQGWHEWRRTGFPELQPSIVNNNDDRIPVRFRYPTAQQVTNLENYQAAVQRQGRDDINTKVWWDE